MDQLVTLMLADGFRYERDTVSNVYAYDGRQGASWMGHSSVLELMEYTVKPGDTIEAWFATERPLAAYAINRGPIVKTRHFESWMNAFLIPHALERVRQYAAADAPASEG